jgi:hypothetical protein
VPQVRVRFLDANLGIDHVPGITAFHRVEVVGLQSCPADLNASSSPSKPTSLLSVVITVNHSFHCPEACDLFVRCREEMRRFDMHIYGYVVMPERVSSGE